MIESRLAQNARSPEFYVREHAACIRRAREYTSNRYPNAPRYGLGWSRDLCMQALRKAAHIRRCLADLRAPMMVLVVDADSIAAQPK